MGLLTGLLTLPLAPVRGTVWLAERLAEEAARELDEEARVRSELREVQLAYELGELTHAEFERAEDALLDRLVLLAEERDHDDRGGVEDGDEHEA